MRVPGPVLRADNMPTKNLWRIGFLIHMIAVILIGFFAYQGLIPNLTPYFRHYDTVCHFLLVGLLAFFLDGTLGFRTLFKKRLSFLRLAPVIVLFIAGTEELLQSLSPRRTCSLSDFVADTIGIFFFSWLAYRIEQWRKTKYQLSGCK